MGKKNANIESTISEVKFFHISKKQQETKKQDLKSKQHSQ